MKRLIPMLLGILLLAGCSQTPPPSESSGAEPGITAEAVAAQYAEAAAVYDWFDLSSPPCVGEPVQLDGQSYRKVDSEDLTTYAALEAKVHSLFSPALADELLSSGNFRDIDGQLYCAQYVRDPNPDFAGRSVSVGHPSDDRFTVELRFWADHPAEIPNPPDGSSGAYLVGYSRTVLNYEKTDAGFRFTNFCSSDALDPNADTVYFFPDRSTLTIDEHTTDWEAICALLVSDSGSFEEIADDLPQRFLDHPQQLLQQLSLLYSSPLWENDDLRYLSVEDVLTWPMIPYEQGSEASLRRACKKALNACDPETEAEQAVLHMLREDYIARTS